MILDHLQNDIFSLSLCLQSLLFIPAPRPRIRRAESSKKGGWARATKKGALCALLRKDQLCKACLERCQYNDPSSLKISPKWNGCKFFSPTQERLYCGGCHCHHPARAFSEAERDKQYSRRACIERKGFVRLCEHGHVSWKTLETHVKYHFQNRLLSDNIPSFFKNCKDISHDVIDDAPVLSVTLYSEGDQTTGMSLGISWITHRTLTVDSQGRCKERELRTMFRELRQAGGRYILPSVSATSFPFMDMGCFGHSDFVCVSYERTGEEARGFRLSDGAEKRAIKDCLYLSRTGEVPEQFAAGKGLLEEYIRVTPCQGTYRRAQHSEGCIIARYCRRFDLGEFVDKNAISAPLKPPHDWFHALDPCLYKLTDDWKDHGSVWPTCKKPSCRNYYRA